MQSHSTQIKTEEFFQQSDSLFTGDNVDLFVSASSPSTSSNCLLGDEVGLFVSASTPSGGTDCQAGDRVELFVSASSPETGVSCPSGDNVALYVSASLSILHALGAHQLEPRRAYNFLLGRLLGARRPFLFMSEARTVWPQMGIPEPKPQPICGVLSAHCSIKPALVGSSQKSKEFRDVKCHSL